MIDDMQVTDALQEATTRLTPTSPSPRLDAEVLLAHVLGTTRTWLIAHGDEEIAPTHQSEFSVLITKRALHRPVAYLTGRKEFYGRSFSVNPSVLIPRPETEELIELAKQYGFSGRILDIGTGSGAIGITLKLELPDCSMTVSDVSLEALQVARLNAASLSAKPIRYVQSDLLGHWLSHDKSKPFGAIIANLPYVDPSWNDTSPEIAHEPEGALFAHDGGLALIKRLLVEAPALLVPEGYLLLEADPSQHDAISRAATAFTAIEHRGYGLLLRKR